MRMPISLALWAAPRHIEFIEQAVLEYATAKRKASGMPKRKQRKELPTPDKFLTNHNQA